MKHQTKSYNNSNKPVKVEIDEEENLSNRDDRKEYKKMEKKEVCFEAKKIQQIKTLEKQTQKKVVNKSGKPTNAHPNIKKKDVNAYNPRSSNNKKQIENDLKLKEDPKKIDNKGIKEDPPINKKVTIIQVCKTKVGLKNEGASCFLNTSIQCLLHLDDFIHEFSQFNNKKDKLVNSFDSIISKMSNSKTKSIKISEFYDKCIELYYNPFEMYSQQDSLDFTRLFLRSLAEVMTETRPKERNIFQETEGVSVEEEAKNYERHLKQYESHVILDVFYGLTVSFYKCISCNKTSFIHEHFLDIPLYINEHAYNPLNKKHNLKEMLDKHFCEELLNFFMNCLFCKENTKQTRKTVITRPPKVLIVSLQKMIPGFNIKNNLTVSFPKEIDIKNYCEDFLIKENTNSLKYKLKSVINHFGNVHYGHYTANIYIDGCWFEFNDIKVTRINNFDFSSSNAYTFFYTLSTE
mmetsp:Transcript_28615/g.29766  ORF Transcript_28615/g.29766 Transcript_28615/m.29766 type:complete len:462 (+) Transcript_28615:48-1433(+)